MRSSKWNVKPRSELFRLHLGFRPIQKFSIYTSDRIARVTRIIPLPAAKGSEVSELDVSIHKRAMELLKAEQNDEAMKLVQERLGENPHNSFFWTTAAIIAGKNRNTEAARVLFKRALECSKSCVPVLQSWGVLEQRAGNLTEAARLFKEALKIDSKHVPSLQALALVESSHRNFAQARSLLNQALIISPDHLPALHVLARVELSCNNESAAKKLLTKVLKLDEANMQAITTLGKIYWNNGDRKSARAVFSSILKSPSKETKSQVLSFWASLEARTNSLKIARCNLEMALDFNPNHLSSLITLASLEARSGMTKRAEELYRKAQKIGPNEPYVINSFAQFLRQLGKIEETKALLKSFLQHSPSCGVSWHILGELAVQEGYFIDARKYFERGCSNQGDSKGALLCLEGLAQLELFLGNVDKARKVYASGERCHSPTSRYYRMWANLEKRQGSCQTARKLYQKAHNTNPQDMRTLLQWGIHERRCENFSKAEECFLKGLRSNKWNRHIWYSYAKMLTQLEDVEKTRSVFEKALKNFPRDGPLLMESAIFEWKQGDLDRARDLFCKGSEVDESRIHLPLLQAWIQMETETNNDEAAAAIQTKYNELIAKPEQT